MSKVVICPDSFKGTMSAITVANIIDEEIAQKYPKTDVVKFPIADGGEGTLDCFKQAIECSSKTLEVKDAYLNPIIAEYIILRSSVAVIEMAKVAGLYLIENKNPSLTSTYGIGEIIRETSQQGHKIIIALGGSSTTDGGAGIAAACGAKFFDENENEFVPMGGTLKNISRIDTTELIKADITCMCDVENPLYGKTGAAFIYAPQKGADSAMVEELDKGLRHYSKKIEEFLHRDISTLSGGGAAGGIGAGLVAFFDATLKSGIDTMLDAVGFDKAVSDADLVITGEGRLDKTSFSGKVIGGIIKRAKIYNVPVIAVCGQIDEKLSLNGSGLLSAYSSKAGRKFFEEIKAHSENDLRDTIKNALTTQIFSMFE
ncbi:MAG TPA: glycerate kinase [Clostridia bacterium]|nr:glycerate kinase [Clostridia bacterium]